MSDKTYERYLQALARKESGGLADPYRAQNQAGYLGKYQMGELALIDAGYYRRDGTSRNDYHGKWTGKDAIHSKEDFLNSPQAQENAIRAYNRKQWGYIRHYGLDEFVGTTLSNGQTLTASGLLAGAHLVGVGNLQKYLHSDGKTVPRDGNKTAISHYIDAMADFDLPFQARRQTASQSSHTATADPEVSPSQNAGAANKDVSREVSRDVAAGVLQFAHANFSSATHEYGRGDQAGQRAGQSGNRIDASRFNRDVDGDQRRGVDCSSLVYYALQGAGFKLDRRVENFTTHTLFHGNQVKAYARERFEVLPRPDGEDKSLQPGDILMFRARKGQSQHVGIFQGYDKQGHIQFFGSQVSTGPASVTIHPGRYWDGASQEIVGVLRPKLDNFEPPVVAQARAAHQPATPAPTLQALAARASPDPFADNPLLTGLLRQVQASCPQLDGKQQCHLATHIADKASKAQLPLREIGELVMEKFGGKELLHAVSRTRDKIASVDVAAAIQEPVEQVMANLGLRFAAAQLPEAASQRQASPLQR